MLLLSDDAENENTEEESDEEDDDDDDDDDTEVKEENGVLVLTDGNYDTFMEGKDTVLVEFYAPWYVYDSSFRFLELQPGSQSHSGICLFHLKVWPL